MEWILYVLLVLALVGDVLLAVLLVRSNHKQPKGIRQKILCVR